MLENIFLKVLQVSILAAVLVALLLLVKALLGKKLSAGWHYSIWLLLVIRLLIPYTPGMPSGFGVKDPGLQHIAPIQEDIGNRADASKYSESEAFLQNTAEASNKGVDKGFTGVNGKEDISKGQHRSTEHSRAIIQAASRFWAAGVILLGLYFLFIRCMMGLKIKKTRVSVENDAVRSTLEDIRELLKIRRKIQVVYQSHIETPAIYGIFRPKLVIPTGILNQLDEDGIRYVIIHELCHLKRGDNLFGILEPVLCMLHWFNPFVWIGFGKMKDDRESACDARVLSCIGVQQRRGYSEALLKILENLSRRQWVYNTVNMGERSASSMTRRLKRINQIKRHSLAFGLAAAIVTTCAGTVSAMALSGQMHLSYPTAPRVISQTLDGRMKSTAEERVLDRNGKELTNLEGLSAQSFKQDDSDVVLTIDADIQQVAEKVLEQVIKDYKITNGASTVIMDPSSGEILAMASKSNTPSGNKNLTDTFEPGSAFKLFTAAAGLEEGLVKPETQVSDAAVSIKGYDIKCWRSYNPHGKETFQEAVENSCNPPFVRIAQSLGINKFYSYMREFGFYDKSGLGLPGEAASLIQQKPSEVDMAVAAIGQRFKVTPIQLVSAYGAIANDGNLIKPRIIKEIRNKKDQSVKTYGVESLRSVLAKGTTEKMRSILEGAVSKGTAANAYVKGYRIAGSIGNAVKINGKHTAVFAGFAPADKPKITCVVFLDEPTTIPSAGAAAAPAAGKLMKAVLDYLSGKQD